MSTHVRTWPPFGSTLEYPLPLPAYLLTKPALPVRLAGSAAVLGVPPRRLREPVRPEYYSALSVLGGTHC